MTQFWDLNNNIENIEIDPIHSPYLAEFAENEITKFN